MMSGREEEIRKRAHELWERDGRPEGKDRQHWEQAERELAFAGDPPGLASSASKKPARGAARSAGSKDPRAAKRPALRVSKKPV